MSSQPVEPEQVTAALPHGLVAVYVMRYRPAQQPPPAPTEELPWLEAEPPW